MKIKDRLENWARWSRWSTGQGGTDCMTGVVCDRMRRAALGNVWSGMNPHTEVDDSDADMVERAWRIQSPKHKALLRWTYVRNASPDFICRRLQMPARPQSIFLLELTRAEQAIEKTLVDRKFPEHNNRTT